MRVVKQLMPRYRSERDGDGARLDEVTELYILSRSALAKETNDEESQEER